MPSTIAILKTTEHSCKLEKLNKQLKLPWVDVQSDKFDTYFTAKDDHLQIIFNDHPSPLAINFLDKATTSKLLNIKHQPLPLLFKAIGFKKNQPLTLLDATTGFASDSMMLAVMGVNIIACERSAAIHALLQDALERARLGPPTFAQAAQRIDLKHIDARARLAQLDNEPDVVYYDPMFTDHGQKALNLLPMRQLRNLVGDDEDAEIFIDELRQQYRGKLVVKRSIHAPEGRQTPHHQLKGKAIRYDVYQ